MPTNRRRNPRGNDVVFGGFTVGTLEWNEHPAAAAGLSMSHGSKYGLMKES